jgi:hypothetical protein
MRATQAYFFSNQDDISILIIFSGNPANIYVFCDPADPSHNIAAWMQLSTTKGRRRRMEWKFPNLSQTGLGCPAAAAAAAAAKCGRSRKERGREAQLEISSLLLRRVMDAAAVDAFVDCGGGGQQ